MTESDPTRKLMAELNKEKHCMALKVADRFTVGWPDVSVDLAGLHTWLELKLGHATFNNLVAQVKKHRLQLEVACDLQKAQARIFYIGWLERNEKVFEMQVWHPLDIRLHVYKPLEAATKPAFVTSEHGEALCHIVELCKGGLV